VLHMCTAHCSMIKDCVRSPEYVPICVDQTNLSTCSCQEWLQLDERNGLCVEKIAECIKPDSSTSEQCCHALYDGDRSLYNHLKNMCRSACSEGSYFDEESNECVFSEGVECFEPVVGPDGSYSSDPETYSEVCCSRTYLGERPHYNYVLHMCTDDCPVKRDCVRSPEYVPICVDSTNLSTCSCQEWLQFDERDGTCVDVDVVECVQPNGSTSEQCCHVLYDGQKSLYNHLKNMCRGACSGASYFDEEANECVYSAGVECFEPVVRPDGNYSSDPETYSEECCAHKYRGEKPYYNYVQHMCTDDCPMVYECVKSPQYGPYCLDPRNFTSCSCGVEFSQGKGSCVEVSSGGDIKLSILQFALLLFSLVLSLVMCSVYSFWQLKQSSGQAHC